ncbi:MAG: HEAT repeat domain-containing protein [Planctomycetota bacterium]|jgi:HEAT repeat protein
MGRTLRVLPLVCALAAGSVRAAERPQVEWMGGWDEAFALARKTGRPVMVCINSKDGEQANDRAAKATYRDPWFVPLSRRFVMIVVSTRKHGGIVGCPRFGKVTCDQHLACWRKLREHHGKEFLLPGTTDEMISPQHAWFAPDGRLLHRKEYELSRDDLLKRMRAVLAELGREPGPENKPPTSSAPMDDTDRAHLERLRTGNAKTRWAALGTLLATEKVDVHAALLKLLKSSRDIALRCDILRAFGHAQVHDARAAIEARLGDEDELIRSFSAVALEGLGDPASIRVLNKRAQTERKPIVRKNLYRAMGACGGPSGNKSAAKALMKALDKDPHQVVRKHAALALALYAGGPGAKSILKRLEQTAARTKDRDVRSALVYTLAQIGNEKSTVRVLKKVLEDMKVDWEQSFVEGAIAKLEGRQAPFYPGWLFSDDRGDPARKEAGEEPKR